MDLAKNVLVENNNHSRRSWAIFVEVESTSRHRKASLIVTVSEDSGGISLILALCTMQIVSGQIQSLSVNCQNVQECAA